MKAKTNHLCNVLAGSMLALLGFESCDRITEQPDEYGAPYAEYQIRGTVTDEDGQPIPGIKARLGMQEVYEDGRKVFHLISLDSAWTDEKGEFLINSDVFMMGEQGGVELTDVDGPSNGGEFLPDIVPFDQMEKEQTEQGKGWYQGSFLLTFTKKLFKK